MESDDIFRSNQHHHKHQSTQAHYDDDKLSQKSYHHNSERKHFFDWSNTLERINANKGLKQLVRVAFIFFLVLAIALIIVLIPYIIKLIKYIDQNGLKGLWEVITSFIGKLWNGSVK